MQLAPNPFAVLTFISAPAVLTNASCVLLFGTGNRYGRAIDRVHELAELFSMEQAPGEIELRLRARQLEAAEQRTQLIVRALTCFYTAVAGFAAATLVSLAGATLVAAQIDSGIGAAFTVGGICGALGVAAMITGAVMLARETTFSFTVLKEERAYLTGVVHQRLAALPKV